MEVSPCAGVGVVGQQHSAQEQLSRIRIIQGQFPCFFRSPSLLQVQLANDVVIQGQLRGRRVDSAFSMEYGVMRYLSILASLLKPSSSCKSF